MVKRVVHVSKKAWARIKKHADRFVKKNPLR